MTALAAAGYYSDNLRTQGEGKQTIEDLIQVAKETLGGALESTLTIAAGSITPVGASHAVDTEAAAATDDLTNIALTNHPDGRVIFLHVVSAARKVVVKQAAGGNGQVFLTRAVDLTLQLNDTILVLQRRGTSWYEIGILFGSAITATQQMTAAQFRGAARVNIASAATLNLDALAGNSANITGTTPVTAVTLGDGAVVEAVAAAALPITAGPSLLLFGIPSGATYISPAGSRIRFIGGPAGVVAVIINNVATVADQRAGTSGAAFVTPLTQNEHPSAVKAYVCFDGINRTGLAYTRSGTTVTVTRNAHGYKTGDLVNIQSATDAAINTAAAAITVTGANTFTFQTAAVGANGTLTVSTRTSDFYKVASVVRNAAADYTINLGVTMADIQFPFSVGSQSAAGIFTSRYDGVSFATTDGSATGTTTSLRIHTHTETGTAVEASPVSVSILGALA